MFWKIPDLTLQLHLLTAKLMSSVGISLLCEILGNMTHHLPFCVESCIQKCLFIVKNCFKVVLFFLGGWHSILHLVPDWGASYTWFLYWEQHGQTQEERVNADCRDKKQNTLEKDCKELVLWERKPSVQLWQFMLCQCYVLLGTCRRLSHLVWVPHRFGACL